MNIDKLYPYQKESARQLLDGQPRADLSEVGTGKTITALGVMAQSGEELFLVVAPKSVAEQWQNKFGEFYSDCKIFRAGSVPKADRHKTYESFRADRHRPRALIVTYEQVRMDIGELTDIQFGIVYADEIHRIGNPKTAVFKAMEKLNSNRRYGATATPLRSSPLQAYGVFNWLIPGLLGKNYYSFQSHFCDFYTPPGQEHIPVFKRQRWFQGFKNLDVLADMIRPYYVMTKMEDAGVYMPPLVEQDIIFPLSKSEQKLYDNIKKEMLLEIDKELLSKMENPLSLYNSVVKLGKLQELTDASEMLGEGTESSKIETLLDHLKDTLIGGGDAEVETATGNKAVIFTRFSRMADILFRELSCYNPAMIQGSTKDRQAQIDKFNTDNACSVIIITTAGNEGINLQRANLMYMVDVPMGSYGSLVQTIGRIKRIGQTKPMVVYYLMAAGTVDIKLKQLLTSKKDISEQMFANLSDLKEFLQ